MPSAALVQDGGEVILPVGPHVVRIAVVLDALSLSRDGVVSVQLLHHGLLHRRARRAVAGRLLVRAVIGAPATRAGLLLVVLAARVTVVTALGPRFVLLRGSRLFLVPPAV